MENFDAKPLTILTVFAVDIVEMNKSPGYAI